MPSSHGKPVRLSPGLEMQGLDARRLFSASPTNFDQFMLAVINRARANPVAEAARLGIDLNEGLSAGQITAAAKQPLAFNSHLLQSSADYTAALLGAYDYFNHYYNGTSPMDRMEAAGYVFTSNYSEGENIAVRASTGALPVTTAITEQEYEDLFIDSGEEGRGHRTNLMDGGFKEIGIGVTAAANYKGLDQSPDQTAYNGVITTHDFAANDDHPYLTGVAYNDSVTADHFYTPGEGMGNVSVSAVNSSTHEAYSITTWASGGYSLQVPPGSYIVTFSGGSLAKPVAYADVVGGSNVEQDAVTSDYFAAVSNGTLTVSGSASGDTINASESGGNVIVTRNGVLETVSATGISQVILGGAGGGDSISASSTMALPTALRGGKGPDTIIGGGGPETLIGGAGLDSIHGGAGAESLAGGKGADTIEAGSAGDTISGALGRNSLIGGSGNDVFYTINSVADTILAGGGSDTAHTDVLDSVAGVQSVLHD